MAQDPLTLAQRYMVIVREHELISSPFFKAHALRVNLIRIKFIALVVIAQMCNVESWGYKQLLFAGLDPSGWAFGIWFAYTWISTAFFAGLSIWGTKWLTERPAMAYVVIWYFWFSSVVMDAPSLLYEASVHHSTVSVTTWLAAMIIMLVLSRRSIVLVFSAFAIVESAFCVWIGADMYYIWMLLVRTTMAGAVAYFLQYPATIAAVLNIKNSSTDPLTNLFNRRGGLANLSTLLTHNHAEERATVFYMLDIDNFKSYNDTFGHQEGDEVIEQIADAVGETFSYKRDLAIRYGGEEILAIASVEKTEVAHILAEKLHNIIDAKAIPAPPGNFHPTVTVSVGYVVIPHDQASADQVDRYIGVADVALYKAKAQGKHCSIELPLSTELPEHNVAMS